MPRRSGNLGMRDLDIVAQDKRTGTMLARAGKRYVVVELLPGASSSFHGWMERGQAKALYRQLTAPARVNVERGRAKALYRRMMAPARVNPAERPRILWFKVRGYWVTATARGAEPVREALRRSYLNGSGFARTNLTVTKPDGFTPSEWESAIRNHAMYVPQYTAARTNPPRDPEFAGVFLLGQEPKKSGRVDGDTAVVESPHRLHAVMDRPFEVWVFGMVDPALGETWNYVTGPMARSAAVEMAKKLLRF